MTGWGKVVCSKARKKAIEREEEGGRRGNEK